MTRTARERSGLALHSVTRLAPAAVLALLREAAAGTGGDISLFAPASAGTGARIHLDRASADTIDFSVVEENPLCAFSAKVTGDENGGTRLRVGGLEKYRVTRTRIYGAIPTGPEVIAGYDAYRMFLHRVADRLAAADDRAETTIGLPAG